MLLDDSPAPMAILKCGLVLNGKSKRKYPLKLLGKPPVWAVSGIFDQPSYPIWNMRWSFDRLFRFKVLHFLIGGGGGMVLVMVESWAFETNAIKRVRKKAKYFFI